MINDAANVLFFACRFEGAGRYRVSVADMGREGSRYPRRAGRGSVS